MRAPSPATLGVALLFVAPAAAQEINTSQLSENGWFSDDTRADGAGAILPAGTNLISTTLTDLPEATSGNMVFDAEILEQIQFGAAPGTPPAGTFKGAVRLRDRGNTMVGKSQISHRIDAPAGHGTGDAFGPSFSAEYHWVGFGPPQVTASLKFGFQTADFGSTGSSSRTGENIWDKVLIYEPGQGNGQSSDGTWKTETIDWSNGEFWFFDRTVGKSSQQEPRTLEEMSTDTTVFDNVTGKTLQDVYDLIVDPGTVLTSVQFGIGSNNPQGDVYVNQLECSAYRSGQLTTFGTPSPFDQNVTPDTIFGMGNGNGGFTVARNDGIELGLRGKLRFPTPQNLFNSNGDGSYTFDAIDVSVGNPEWQWDWTVNTDVDDATGRKVGDLTYELGIDYDPSSDTNYLAFDPITQTALNQDPDHSFGDNTSMGDDGVEFGTDPAGYANALATFNVLQQSWRHTFFDDPVNFPFDPTVDGQYEVYLAAFENGEEVSRVQITFYAVNGVSMTVEADPCQTDQDATIPGTQVAYELYLRNPDDVDITGYKAFLAYDPATMTYEGSASSYADEGFTLNIDPIENTGSPAGSLTLDGNTFTGVGTSAPVDGDALLATLVFTVTDCDLNDVTFDLTQAFPSEFSFEGDPIATNLVNSVDVLGDGEAPMIAPMASIVQASDAGACESAVVTYAIPAVTDNCDASPTIVCDPPSGTVFTAGTTIVTCTATDECGNVSVTTFDVTITDTVLVDVEVILVGSDADTRCINFVPDSCAGATSVPLTFVKSGFDAVAMATIELPCDDWTQLCAKDEQHTLWDTVTLTDDGAKYSTDVPLVLRGGDTDNDGDVDINDVTLFIAQFGDTSSDGGCAYDGTTRDADFSNDGAVGTEDYSSLVANWLEITDCACTVPASGGELGRRGLQRRIPVRGGAAQAADLTRDGFVDWRDVQVLERRYRLSGELSRAMRRSR